MVISLLKTESIFVGTASELAEKIKTKTRPNILSKKLMQNRTAFAEEGIFIENSRTGTKRELTILYEPPANDSNDDKNDSDSVPDLLSQSSQLSHCHKSFDYVEVS